MDDIKQDLQNTVSKVLNRVLLGGGGLREVFVFLFIIAFLLIQYFPNITIAIGSYSIELHSATTYLAIASAILLVVSNLLDFIFRSIITNIDLNKPVRILVTFFRSFQKYQKTRAVDKIILDTKNRTYEIENVKMQKKFLKFSTDLIIKPEYQTGWRAGITLGNDDDLNIHLHTDSFDELLSLRVLYKNEELSRVRLQQFSPNEKIEFSVHNFNGLFSIQVYHNGVFREYTDLKLNEYLTGAVKLQAWSHPEDRTFEVEFRNVFLQFI